METVDKNDTITLKINLWFRSLNKENDGVINCIVWLYLYMHTHPLTTIFLCELWSQHLTEDLRYNGKQTMKIILKICLEKCYRIKILRWDIKSNKCNFFILLHMSSVGGASQTKLMFETFFFFFEKKRKSNYIILF